MVPSEFPSKKRPNILIVILDAVRARNLGCYGYGLGTSPVIDTLAQNSAVFTNAFSCSNVTEPSVTSILSGKHIRSHGILHIGTELNEKELAAISEITFMQEMLKGLGYRTYAADWMGRWFRRGFDQYGNTPKRVVLQERAVNAIKKIPVIRELSSFVFRKMMPLGMRDAVVRTFDGKYPTDAAVKFIRDSPSAPFFMFFHYFDAHVPYNPGNFASRFPHPEFKGKLCKDIISGRPVSGPLQQYFDSVLGGNDVETLLSKYDGAVAYDDWLLGNIIDALKSKGIFEDTLIIVTADHGESLLEHQMLFDHHGMYDVTINVPLLIHYPKLFKRMKIDVLVQHTDLLPTILDILGEKVPGNVDGKSILPLVNGKVHKLRDEVFCEETYLQQKQCIRDLSHKFMAATAEGSAFCRKCETTHGGIEELYDLKADPGETNNIVKSKLEVAARMREKLQKFNTDLMRKREAGKLDAAIAEL